LLNLLAVLAVVAGLGIVGYALLRDTDREVAEPVPGLNVSCYAYRDVDRDGTYDVGDRPFAGLAVEGRGPDDSTFAASNTAGFANFEMRLGSDAAFVDRAGTYEFEALVPAGWGLTSGPSVQTVEFVETDGSPVGVTAAGQCAPYGLAPELTVRGTDQQVSIESVDGSTQLAVTVTDGRFDATIDAGSWSITADGEAARSFDVATDPVVLAGLVADSQPPDPLPNEVVVGFDDLITADTLIEIPSGYRGLNWSNWVATHRILYGGPGYVNGTTSGEYAAYNSSGNPASVTADEPFDFVGAHISSAWPEGESSDVIVRAWRDEDLVHEDRFAVSSTGPIFFDADYRGITRLELSSVASWQFVVDDAMFRTASPGG
jgi:hypothetical protein